AVDLARAFSTRLEKLGPRYNALALPLSERAIKKAKDIDGDIKRDRFRSQLMGIPFGAKDLLSLAGVPTAWGAKPYAAQVFDDDATALKKLDKAGAVLIGKLSMVQLAGGGGYRYAAAALTGPRFFPSVVVRVTPVSSFTGVISQNAFRTDDSGPIYGLAIFSSM